MASWFKSGSPEFDKLVTDATVSSLEDIRKSLEVADLIRSKTVQPKDAMRSLKKRLGNQNPNVQISTLQLIDTCVKNGGAHFVQEIATPEFLNYFELMLKGEGAFEAEPSVKQKVLEMVQNWTSASEGRWELRQIGDLYKTLQRQGYHFPPKEEMAGSMLDSNAPPEWQDSDVCMRCRSAFTFTNRKHHCRNCGMVFDQQCSSKTMELPHLGIYQEVRVDDGCYEKLSKKSHSTGSQRRVSFASTPGPMQPRNARVDSTFDNDLRQALAMSLEEAKAGTSAGYVPQSKKTDTKSSDRSREEDDDPELAAAIALSLKEAEEQAKKHAASMKKSSSSAQSATQPFIMPKNDYELTALESDSIDLFATAVNRLQHEPPGTILRQPQVQELYETIGKLRPKLARTLGESMSKSEALLDLHAKLSTVVRYYDRMLEERLNNTYTQRTSAYGGYAPPQPYGNGYPTMAAPSQPPPSIAPGGAENFYYNNAPPDSYAPPQPQPSMPALERSYSYASQKQDPQAAPYSQHQPPPQAPPAQYAPPSPQMYHQQQSQQAPESIQQPGLYPSMPPPELQQQQYPPQQSPQQQQPHPQSNIPYPSFNTSYPPMDNQYPVHQPQQQQQPPPQQPHQLPQQSQPYSAPPPLQQSAPAAPPPVQENLIEL